MSKFGTTRLITLSPFYMINNETRVSFSLSLSLFSHWFFCCTPVVVMLLEVYIYGTKYFHVLAFCAG